MHERFLQVTYNDGLYSFEELLERDNSLHNRNVQCPAIELYMCPDIMKGVFSLNTSSNCDIRSRRTFTARSVKTGCYGTESLSYLAPKVWELIPNNIESLENQENSRKHKKIGNLMYARVGFADSTFHKSALCSACSFNFHFYIY